MGWETRRSGNRLYRYYTRSRKRNGRVIREYVGGGVAGNLAALSDAEAREERKAIRDAILAESKALESLCQEGDAVSAAIDAHINASLLAAGYHRHSRGEWRRQNGREKKRN